MSHARSLRFVVIPAVLAAVLTTACVFATPASAARPTPTITVLVTNDDGVAAPGLDTLVQALRRVKNTKVVVVAPATNQTGAGGKTSPGTLVVQPATTASGYTAKAVQGFPADTITAAIDQLGLEPNVVMSGINIGQNLGTNVDLSGTVGAARAAAQHGIPAVALSQGFGDAPQYATAAAAARKWLAANRAALVKKPKGAITTIENINAPNCPSGKPRGTKQVSTAPNADNAFVAAAGDCTATGPTPTTDIEAFNDGYVAVAPVPVS